LPDEWKRAPSCPAPLSVANGQLPAGGRYISQISFSNVARMPVADQEQIIASLKQQRYSGTPDEIVKQLLERVNAEWANLGFVNVRSRGDAWLVSGNPAGEGISMNVYVEEGPRYKLGGISFQNNRAIASLEVLRLQFHIRDGAIFSREKIAQGLADLRLAYRQLGYINFTAVPSTTFDEDNGLIYLVMDLDEGKQYYVSNIKIDGVAAENSQKLLRNSLLHRGQVYNERLLRYSMKGLSLPDPNSIATYKLEQNEADGSVAIAIRFVDCPGH
jgi:outer membrane protein assembly factor BamA